MWKQWIGLFVLLGVCGCATREEPEVLSGVPAEETLVAVEETVLKEGMAEEVAAPAPLVPHEGWTVTASSSESDELGPAKAIDGSAVTRWASTWNDKEWWMVDFGSEEQLARINVLWETAFAREYRVQVCADDGEWKDVYVERSGRPGPRVIELDVQPV
ncbi:MAG: discoidin domain-containing protein, partial [Kiritimatiellae bacterium]|nr:discoidin domain-containing protein [Kiritimatiellia bacterium]